MFHDDMRGWQIARRRMARQFRVHFLAKLWIRSKRLRDMKTSYLRRSLQRAPRLQRPLDDRQIRLLRIRPGSALSTISCDFQSVYLEFAENYAALSYTWGTAAPSIPILLQGKVVLVSENLYLALLHLQKRKVTLIWVDALCINQEDLDERARQVSHMDEVYRRASVVWVWLGDGDESSELAIDGLHGLRQHLDWDGAVPRERLMKEMNEHPRTWRAISELLYRPWFRRMWIIQEVLSARRAMMICGKDIIEMNLFLKLINSLAKAWILKSVLALHPNRHELSGGPMKVAFEQLNFLLRAKFDYLDCLFQHKFKTTLLNFMAETRWAEATNPLDKVYGVFSLASDARTLGYEEFCGDKLSPRRLLKIDYTLTKEELFINVTKAIICTSRSLEILRFARYEPNSTSNLPSWVADWDNSTPHEVHDYLPVEPIKKNGSHSWRPVPRSRETSDLWTAGIPNMITARCGPYFKIRHDNTLTVTGIHFDTIKTISSQVIPQDQSSYSFDPQNKDFAGKAREYHHFLELLKIWSEDCVRQAQTCAPYPTGQSLSNALWSMLNGYDTRKENQVPGGCLALPRAIENVQVMLGNVAKQVSSKHMDALSGVLGCAALSSFVHHLSQLPNMCEKYLAQKFATTQKRYMGLMPEGAKVGDILCAIYGCTTPVVLRSCENGFFRLIGHGKVHSFDFDDAVIESTFTRRKDMKKSRKGVIFATFDPAGRRYYTLLKETADFTLL